MTDPRDPTALLRHAALAGDRRLFELLGRALGGSVTGPTGRDGSVAERSALGWRVYSTLVTRLSLGDPGNCEDRP